jgi:hypothetical protein
LGVKQRDMVVFGEGLLRVQRRCIVAHRLAGNLRRPVLALQAAGAQRVDAVCPPLQVMAENPGLALPDAGQTVVLGVAEGRLSVPDQV